MVFLSPSLPLWHSLLFSFYSGGCNLANLSCASSMRLWPWIALNSADLSKQVFGGFALSLCVFHSPFFLHEAHIIFCLLFPKLLLLVFLSYSTLDGAGTLPGAGVLPSISLNSLLSHCTPSFHPQGLWAWTTIRYVATLKAGIEVAYNQREKNYREGDAYANIHILWWGWWLAMCCPHSFWTFSLFLL